MLHFNQNSLVTIVKRPPPFPGPPVPFVWADEHDVLTAAWLQHQGISVNKEIAGQATNIVSREHPFHPIRDYLNSLKWDGVRRIDTWLTVYLGVAPSEYAWAVGAKFLIGAVARIFQPGCKVDTCLILEGPQGAQKSTALRTLAGADLFTDDISELGSKDSVMQTRGVWIIELSELDALKGAELSRVKAFMSRQVDRIRPPYGKRVVDLPRECVFAGTVNKDTYLTDETGGRRFWPVRCGTISIADLESDRGQLWTEAVERFRAGEAWWLDNQALTQSAAAEVAERHEPGAWDELITDWVKAPKERLDLSGNPVAPLISTTDFVTVRDILIHSIGKDPKVWTQADQNRVAKSLTAKGWKRHQKRLGGGAQKWGYIPPPVPPVSPVEP